MDATRLRRSFAASLYALSATAALLVAAPVASSSASSARSAALVVPAARADMAMAIDVNHNVVLFGGYVAETGTSLGDTWTWDGSGWTRQHPATSPAPRCCFQMAYQASHHQLVLYGGFGPSGPHGGYFDDTWTWDGSNWTQQHPATNPPIGANSGMAYDTHRKRIVMFMGQGIGEKSVWEWDGSNWTEVVPSTIPIWRELPGAAYDGVGRRVMMFGGTDCGDFCYVYGDTWTWGGANWIQRNPASKPSRRSSMGMAYDATRQRVVLFGGNTETGFANDTWTWDGRSWTLRNPASSPSVRERMGMTWDVDRRQIVMFGGRDAPFNYRDFADTWIWDGFNWTCVSNCS